MKRLVLESLLLLLYLDWLMGRRDFKSVYSIVGRTKIKPGSRSIPNEKLCLAVDYACIFYFKRVLCLQRSAATTILLRRHGWSADMVIGTQIVPFKSHAWCEINGEVVNDKPYIREIFAVLDRC